MSNNYKKAITVVLLVAILLLIKTTDFQKGLNKIVYQKEFNLMDDIVNDNKLADLPQTKSMNPIYTSFIFLIEENSTYLRKEGLGEHKDNGEAVSFLTINSELEALKRIERSIEVNKHLTQGNKYDLKSNINILRNNAGIIRDLLNELNLHS